MVPRRRPRRASMVALLLACLIAGSGTVHAAAEHGSGSHRAPGAVRWRVLNTVAVGSRPVAVVVDERAGRAFVAGGDGGGGVGGGRGGALGNNPPPGGAPAFWAGAPAGAGGRRTPRGLVAPLY